MNCPVCFQNLNRENIKSSIVYQCPECSGIWCDRGEFITFVNKLAIEKISYSKEEINFEPRKIQTIHNLREAKRFCPNCNTVMVKFNYASDSNIILDKCPNCGGIWADSGEIPKVIKHLKINPQNIQLAESILEPIKVYDSAQRGTQNIVKDFVFSGCRFLLIPLSTEVPVYKIPYVSIMMIILPVVVFIQHALSLNSQSPYGFVTGEFDPTFLASIFLHTDFPNLVCNIFCLWIFATAVESAIGSLKFSALYVLSGLCALILHSIFVEDTTPVMATGAAIFGIIGSFIVLFPQSKVKVWLGYAEVYVNTFIFAVIFFMAQLIYQLFTSINQYKIEVKNVSLIFYFPALALGIFFTAFLCKKVKIKPDTGKSV